MGSPIRITGMNSGLDTESIIQALTSSKKEKVTKLEGDQKRLTWKQDKWKELNKKVTDLYNGKLASMRFTDAFSKKTTTVSRPSAVTVVTAANAMNTTQRLSVESLASNAYMTGAELKTAGGARATGNTRLSDLAGANFTTHTETEDLEANTYQVKTNAEGKALYQKLNADGTAVEVDGKPVYVTEEEKNNDTSDATFVKAYQQVDTTSSSPVYKDIDDLDTLRDIEANEETKLAETTAYTKSTTVQDKQSFKVKFGDGSEKSVEVTGDMTVNDLVSKLKGLRSNNGDSLNVNFDAGQGRLYIASSKSGDDASFSLDFGTDEAGKALGNVLGLLSKEDGGNATYERGSDAKIHLNGETYTSANNNFEINGLTLTVNETTKNSAGGLDEITLTTKSDASGVYDMVKDFFKEYNELINEMDKLYNADSAKSYEMLTKDQKEEMTEDEVEEWENKIKEGLLSKDRTLQSVSSAMKEVMAGIYEATNSKGETKSLSLMDFGIGTLSYFSAKNNERYAYHINGDKDNENFDVKNAEDRLSKMIADDPDLVASFFSTLSKKLYSTLTDLMKGSEFSTSYTIYEDKLMNKQYSSYTDKIADANEKLTQAEDKYYKKFSKMETTLGTLNSTQSSLASYFGMG